MFLIQIALKLTFNNILSKFYNFIKTFKKNNKIYIIIGN